MSNRHLLKTFASRRVPGQLIVQITEKCNALCGQCGMRATNRFPRHTLAADTVRRIIDHAAANGVGAVSFTGGEPLLCLDMLIDMIDHAHRAGIRYIRTGTNGFLLRYGGNRDRFYSRVQHLVDRLAATRVRNFWISIDSADAGRHEALRGLPGVVKGVEMALPLFHEAGLYPSVNLGINRYTGGAGKPLYLTSDTPRGRAAFFRASQTAFANFYRFVIDLGFTIANACYPMSMDDESQAVYSASSTDDIVNFTTTEKILLMEALRDTIPEFRDQIRIFSPLCSLHALIRQYRRNPVHSPCLGGIDFFFVDAQKAHTYPCGYRAGDDFGPYWELDPSKLDRTVQCDRCDWECFRDPTELFAPFLNRFSLPWYKKMAKDPGFLKFWIKDLMYYRACGFFDGRRPMV